MKAAKLVEGLFGHPERVHRRGHPSVEHHLSDGLSNLLFGNTDVQRALNVAAKELRAVSQDCNGGDGAETARLQVQSGAVVNFPVDNLVHQVHYFRGKLGHGGWRTGVGVVAVIKNAEIRRRLAQIFGAMFWDILGAIVGGQ